MGCILIAKYFGSSFRQNIVGIGTVDNKLETGIVAVVVLKIRALAYPETYILYVTCISSIYNKYSVEILIYSCEYNI